MPGGRSGDIAQKKTETSLIEKFLYPKFGPGQLWEHAADLVRKGGGEIHFGIQIDRINVEGNKVVSVEGRNEAGERVTYAGDYFFSTMPIRDLVRGLSAPVPAEVSEVAEGLMYRDFITVGLLASKLAVTEKDGSPLKDNWIYIQEPDVVVGRLQIFNNWSPWLVGTPGKVWIGLEYFCNDTDPLWKLSDEEMAKFAIAEIAKIGILKAEDVEDSHVVRVPKTYPAYFGSYDRFDVIRSYLDGFENLFLVGRNGMHKYNNQDHSMLTAMTAVENIVNGVTTKDNIWAINTEMEYHEEKASMQSNLVQPPECRIQHGGKGDPGPVRRHQPFCRWQYAAENQRGCPDGRPQHHNFRQRGPNGVVVEEDPRPGKVQEQLDEKQRQSPGSQRRSGRLPNPPRGNRHQDVEQSPDRPKDPIRRSDDRPGQRPIPSRNLACRPRAAHARHRKAKSYPANQRNPAHLGLP